MEKCYIDKTIVSEKSSGGAHKHLTYELYILFEGKKTYFIENEEYELEKNSIMCTPPPFNALYPRRSQRAIRFVL